MSVALTAEQALRLWHDVNLEIVHDEQPDLSPRQASILLTVYLEAPPHTVRGLASKLDVSKPVISRVGDEQTAVRTHGDSVGVVDPRLQGRATVSRVSALPGTGHGVDDPVRSHATDPAIVGIGDVQAAIRTDRELRYELEQRYTYYDTKSINIV